MMNLIEMIKRHERLAITYRIDDLNRFGYGHRADESPTLNCLHRNLDQAPITEDEAEQQLAADVLYIFNYLPNFMPITEFNYVRQQAAVALVYWLGIYEFQLNKPLQQALLNKDFARVAELVLMLKPVRRAEQLAKWFATGEYHEA